GDFTFTGVAPGVYALSARADGIFACCAMHVVSDDMASSEMFPKTAEIAAAGIDYSIIKSSIIRYLPPANAGDKASISNVDLKSISNRVVSEDLFRVARKNGGMQGQIHTAGANGANLVGGGLMNIFLIHDGETVDRVVSNRDGSFEFANVEAGEYAILAIGISGLGMTGFELVDENATESVNATVNSNGETFVGIFGRLCDRFSMQVAPLPMAIEAVDEVIIEEVIVQEETIIDDGMIVEDGFGTAVDAFGNPVDAFGNPVGGGGFAGGGGSYGGGFGGGGGGGFGGGLGGIASLAGLGIVAASLDDDDNNVFPPQPASPIVP
ncbi:MAG: carboxypeptidase regulatory-like domain-containing protein, partial [Rhodopirellula bahusiensis]